MLRLPPDVSGNRRAASLTGLPPVGECSLEDILPAPARLHLDAAV
jgi:hypothetical protein